ncbi:hypothetical protein NL676_027274 [Syzygium grande]|nr:hypothetical protein NL676_027274 [Syzygium grande]
MDIRGYNQNGHDLYIRSAASESGSIGMGTVVGALIILLYFTSSTITGISGALDTLTTDQSMQHGKSIVSAGGTFELGFFSLHYPPKHYLGIWYKKINPVKVVWVANRVCPLTDSSGTLKFTRQGSLILLDGNETEIWSSNSSKASHHPVAQLLDSGNLVILLKQGSTVKSRLRPWIGVRYGGMPNLNPDLKYTYEFVLTEQEMYCHYQFFNRSVISRLYLNPDGVVQRFTWVDQTQSWVLFLVGPSDDCDLYTYCGAYASCNINKSPACQCLNGFSPKVPQERSTLNRIGHSSQKKEKLIIGSIAVTLLLFLGGISEFLRGSENVECSGEDPELPLFEFATIADATNNFSTDNKLGEGFGPVYRIKSGGSCLIGGRDFTSSAE